MAVIETVVQEVARYVTSEAVIQGAAIYGAYKAQEAGRRIRSEG